MALTDVLGAALPAAGMAFGGPAGAALGAFAGGLYQNAQADKTMKKWDQLDRQIPLNDPEQQRFLGRLERQERQYRGGTDPSTALALRLSQQAGAQTQSNLARAGGPGTVQNLLSSQNVTQRNIAGSAANAAALADQMVGAQGSLINAMAERRYDRQRYRRDLALAQGAQQRQDANNQMMSAIGLLPQAGLSFGGSRSAGRPSAQPMGAMGGAWRSQGTGGPIPVAPTAAPQYAMLPGSVQAPTSAYDMGQQVLL